MKKGKARIIIGLVLIFLQLLSVLGNAKSGIGISLSFNNFEIFLYDLLFLLGSLWSGILGLILLISGLISYNKKPKETKNLKKETNDKLISLFAEAFAEATKVSQETNPVLLKGQRPNEPDYGYSESNPICSSTLVGTDIYLGKLRTTDGKKFTWQRAGDARADCNGVTDVGMDKYQLYLDDKPYKILYVVPYVAEATSPPYGLVLLDESFYDENSIVSNPTNEVVKNTHASQNKNTTTEIEQSQRNESPRYCTFCGGIIDNINKKCSNCGKTCKNNKIMVIVLSIIIALLLIFVGMFMIINSPSESPSISNSSISSTSSDANGTTTLHQHSYSKTVEKPSSCKEEGLAKFTCNCGDTYTESITKSEHSYSKATCTKPKTCSTCGDTQGTSLGHTIIDGVCSKCGTVKVTIEQLQGAWLLTYTDGDYIKMNISGNTASVEETNWDGSILYWNGSVQLTSNGFKVSGSYQGVNVYGESYTANITQHCYISKITQNYFVDTFDDNGPYTWHKQ